MSLGFWELYWEWPAAVVEYASKLVGGYDVAGIKRLLAIVAVRGDGFIGDIARSLLNDESRLSMIIDELRSGLKPRAEVLKVVGEYFSGLGLS